MARKRSCFCSYCEGKEGGFCPNKKMTGQWVTHQLEAKKKPKEQKGKKETVSYKEKDLDMPSILPSRRKRKTGISTTCKPIVSENLTSERRDFFSKIQSVLTKVKSFEVFCKKCFCWKKYKLMKCTHSKFLVAWLKKHQPR